MRLIDNWKVDNMTVICSDHGAECLDFHIIAMQTPKKFKTLISENSWGIMFENKTAMS